MNKNNIIILVVLVIISLITLGIIFLIGGFETTEEAKSEYKEIVLLEDESLFFSVALNINKICEYVNLNDSNKLISILDKEYIDRNNIDSNNVIEYFDKYFETSITAKNIYVVSSGKNYKFFIKGYLKNEIMDEFSSIKEVVYYILNYDIKLGIFSIEEIDSSKYLEYIDSKDFKFNSLSKNEYNKFDYTNMSEYSIVSIYFYDFFNNIFSNPEYAYDSLSEETKTKYFDTYDKFINEINNNSEYYSTLEISEYNVSGNLYYYKDTEGNEYTFIVNSIMDYSVIFNKE